MGEARKFKVKNTDNEEVLEKEVRIAELLARRAEARLRQLEADRKRTELLRAKNASRAGGAGTPETTPSDDARQNDSAGD